MIFFFIDLGRLLRVFVVERRCSHRKRFRSARTEWQWWRKLCRWVGCGTKHRKAMHQASRGNRSPDARRVPRITLEEEGETGTTFSFNNEDTLTLKNALTWKTMKLSLFDKKDIVRRLKFILIQVSSSSNYSGFWKEIFLLFF